MHCSRRIKPTRPFAELTEGPTVRVVVGSSVQTQKHHNLHILLLEVVSPYLETKIQNARQNAAPGAELQIHLTDVKAKPFSEFVNWLHHQPLSIHRIGLMVSTYLLAHKFQIENLKNDIVDDLGEHHTLSDNRNIGPGRTQLIEMRRLCDSLKPSQHPCSNQLLRYLIDHTVYHRKMGHWKHAECYETYRALKCGDEKVFDWFDTSSEKLLYNMGITPEYLRANSRVTLTIKSENGEDTTEAESKENKRFTIKAMEVPADRIECYYHEHKAPISI